MRSSLHPDALALAPRLEPAPAPSMTLDQFLTAAVSFLTASVVLTLWRVSTAEESSNQ